MLVAGAIALGFAVPLAFMKGLAGISLIKLPIPLIAVPLRSGTFASVIQVAMAFIGCIGFAIYLNMKRKQVIYSGIGGAIAWIIYLLIADFMGGLFIPTLVASVFIGIYSEIMAKVNKAPATIFFTSVAIALIPGSALYYAMDALIDRNVESSASYGNTALTIALAISMGIVLVAVFNKIIHEIRRK